MIKVITASGICLLAIYLLNKEDIKYLVYECMLCNVDQVLNTILKNSKNAGIYTYIIIVYIYFFFDWRMKN